MGISFGGGGGGGSSSGGGAAPPWDASEDVDEGSQRTILVAGIKTLLVSKSTRTTGAAMNITELANWDYVGQNGTPAFPPATLVPIGFQIFHLNRWYECNVDHGSRPTFNADEVADWFDNGGAGAPVFLTYLGVGLTTGVLFDPLYRIPPV